MIGLYKVGVCGRFVVAVGTEGGDIELLADSKSYPLIESCERLEVRNKLLVPDAVPVIVLAGVTVGNAIPLSASLGNCFSSS